MATHGHEGNSTSPLKRILFFLSRFVTMYGMFELVQVWPSSTLIQQPPGQQSSSPTVQGLSGFNHGHNELPKSGRHEHGLHEFLRELDQWYETEINVDHHDDGNGHGHKEDGDANGDDGHSESSEKDVKKVEELDKRDANNQLASPRGDMIPDKESIKDEDISFIDPFSNMWTESSAEHSGTHSKLPTEELMMNVNEKKVDESIKIHVDEDDFYNISDDDLERLLNSYTE